MTSMQNVKNINNTSIFQVSSFFYKVYKICIPFVTFKLTLKQRIYYQVEHNWGKNKRGMVSTFN